MEIIVMFFESSQSEYFPSFLEKLDSDSLFQFQRAIKTKQPLLLADLLERLDGTPILIPVELLKLAIQYEVDSDNLSQLASRCTQNDLEDGLRYAIKHYRNQSIEIIANRLSSLSQDLPRFSLDLMGSFSKINYSILYLFEMCPAFSISSAQVQQATNLSAEAKKNYSSLLDFVDIFKTLYEVAEHGTPIADSFELSMRLASIIARLNSHALQPSYLQQSPSMEFATKQLQEFFKEDFGRTLRYLSSDLFDLKDALDCSRALLKILSKQGEDALTQHLRSIRKPEANSKLSQFFEHFTPLRIRMLDGLTDRNEVQNNELNMK